MSSSDTGRETRLDKIVDYLNEFLNYDGYRLKKDKSRNSYKVVRLDGG